MDVGQLAEQLLGYFRDMMAAAVGCDEQLMLHTDAPEYDGLKTAGQQLGLETILAVVQILDQTLVRMRQSPHVRILVEMALVRICKLEELDELPSLVAQLTSSATAAGSTTSPKRQAAPRAEKKSEVTSRPANVAAAAPIEQTPLTSDSAEAIWARVLDDVGGMTAEFARHYAALATTAPNRLVVSFKPQYTHEKESCERPDWKARLEESMARVTGGQVRIDFEVLPGPPASAAKSRPQLSRRQRLKAAESNPLVSRALELFDGEITDVSDASPDGL